MLDKMSMQFMGFEQNAVDFLNNLEVNNNKQWFESNRQLYHDYIVEPFQALVMELSPTLLSIDSQIEINSVVGRTISRMNRDVRFSKDKSPYRTNVWVTFKRPSKEWQNYPGLFFELTQTSYRYGMGFYSANRETMDTLREAIDLDEEKFEEAISFYYNQNIFVLEGDKYKRIIDSSKSERILDWYQRKNLYLVCNRPLDDCLFSRQLLEDISTGFRQLSDFYHYLFKLSGK